MQAKYNWSIQGNGRSNEYPEIAYAILTPMSRGKVDIPPMEKQV